MAVKVKQHTGNGNHEEVSFAKKTFQDMMAAIKKTEEQLDLGEISFKETAARVRVMRQYLKDAPLLPTVKTSLRSMVDLLNLRLKYHRFAKESGSDAIWGREEH
jgi:hypothetical protein